MSRAADRAYSEIRGMILSGELAPGSQVSEEALAVHCKVSRTPVRDALRRLESDLLVRRSESQRTFVTEWSLDDIADGFELRAMLESHAAKRAAERISEAEIALLRLHNRAIHTAISSARPDINAFFEAWEAGESRADVNFDGGVDGSDIDTFFEAWEAGGC